MDPVSQGGGASSHLQSQMASSSSSDDGTNYFGFVATFGNINGFNILNAYKGFGQHFGLSALAGSVGNSFGLSNMMGGNRLEKSPMGKMFSKKTGKLKGGGDLSMASKGPSISGPQIPGGGGGSSAPEIG